ncbi:hypothetical protein ABLN87_16275 [Ruegeria sp. SCPT10]|uniref:hypothetical protein n=1 Tax=Ruegeria sp. SCP10 TaxID=3141377 RepID=UPI00333AE3AC
MAQNTEFEPMDQFIVRAIPGVHAATTDILEGDKIAFTYFSIRVDQEELRATADTWCAQFDGKARLDSDVRMGGYLWLFGRRQTTFDCAVGN